MADKLTEIRGTTSDAVSIIRELGSPGVQESLTKILETTKTAKEIVDTFKTPEFVTNIENIRRTAESVQSSSAKIENVVIELKEAGIFEQARETVKSANKAIISLGDSSEFGEIGGTLKGTLTSITELIDELKTTLQTSKKSGSVKNTRDTLAEVSDAYKKISNSS